MAPPPPHLLQQQHCRQQQPRWRCHHPHPVQQLPPLLLRLGPSLLLL
jgi:hypothetical protein